MSTWWTDHPDLESVARHGRGEMAEEAASAEADNELLRKRRRSLIDVCFEWMNRGDLATVETVGSQFEGRLVAAVNDLLILHTKTIEVALNVTAVRFIRSDIRAAFEGSSGDRSVSSFRAQLGRFEVDATPIRLVGEAFDLTAVIDASTDDHVLVRDAQGVEWALPRNEIAYSASPMSGTG